MSEVSCGTGYEGRILVCFGEPYVLERTLLSRDFTKEKKNGGNGPDYLHIVCSCFGTGLY